MSFARQPRGRERQGPHFLPPHQIQLWPPPPSHPEWVWRFLLASRLSLQKGIFPGAREGKAIRTPQEWAAGETAGACGEVMGELRELEVGILQLENGRDRCRGCFIFYSFGCKFPFWFYLLRWSSNSRLLYFLPSLPRVELGLSTCHLRISLPADLCEPALSKRAF